MSLILFSSVLFQLITDKAEFIELVDYKQVRASINYSTSIQGSRFRLVLLFYLSLIFDLIKFPQITNIHWD